MEEMIYISPPRLSPLPPQIFFALILSFKNIVCLVIELLSVPLSPAAEAPARIGVETPLLFKKMPLGGQSETPIRVLGLRLSKAFGEWWVLFLLCYRGSYNGPGRVWAPPGLTQTQERCSALPKPEAFSPP